MVVYTWFKKSESWEKMIEKKFSRPNGDFSKQCYCNNIQEIDRFIQQDSISIVQLEALFLLVFFGVKNVSEGNEYSCLGRDLRTGSTAAEFLLDTRSRLNFLDAFFTSL